jgi:PPOX class probable F420-dependent enzyme
MRCERPTKGGENADPGELRPHEQRWQSGRMTAPQPRRRKIATARRVERAELIEFVGTRTRCVLATTRRDGRPQLSPVTFGVDVEGRIVISTYPQRAKAANARANPAVSVCVVSDDWNGEYVQVDGHAEVLDMPEALDGLVEYFRSISGEHPDWDEYRDAMRKQNKSLVRVTIDRWGPIATGGFPPDLDDA